MKNTISRIYIKRFSFTFDFFFLACFLFKSLYLSLGFNRHWTGKLLQCDAGTHIATFSKGHKAADCPRLRRQNLSNGEKQSETETFNGCRLGLATQLLSTEWIKHSGSTSNKQSKWTSKQKAQQQTEHGSFPWIGGPIWRLWQISQPTQKCAMNLHIWGVCTCEQCVCMCECSLTEIDERSPKLLIWWMRQTTHNRTQWRKAEGSDCQHHIFVRLCLHTQCVCVELDKGTFSFASVCIFNLIFYQYGRWVNTEGEKLKKVTEY